MFDTTSNRDELERLAEQFVADYRAGKRPSLTEYIGRLPHRADEIRELFPALVEIEQLKPVTGERTSDFVPNTTACDPECIGEFRILRRIGTGGMGVVYEAVQESLGRHVALKLLPIDALADPKRLERFRREAKSAARLHHTNIVPVFGTGEAAGRHYYAMQYISGQPLDDVITELRRFHEKTIPATPNPASEVAKNLLVQSFDGMASVGVAPQVSNLTDTSLAAKTSLSENRRNYWLSVANLTAQVADALGYAHGQGVLHRDIKPANLLLDLQGNVWVTDFGLAKTNDADDLTQAGDIVGTIRYMAPERFEGGGDHRADLYALGLTLYELLTLRPAYASDKRPKLLEQVLAADPPKPRSINPSIPRDLETIVLKAIARDPAMRYQSATEMAQDLRRYLEDRPIRARRASPIEMAFRWCRRNPAVAALIAAVLLTTTIGSVAASVLALRAQSLAEIADKNAQAAGMERDRAQDAELQGRYKLFEAYVSEAKANRLARHAGQRFDTLARVAEASALGRELGIAEERIAELRQIAITALSVPDIAQRFLGEIPPDLDFIDLSSDQRRVIFRANDNTLSIREVSSGKTLAEIPSKEKRTFGYFSPDGRRVLRYHPESNSAVELWDVSGQDIRLLKADRNKVFKYSFRSDSKLLAMSLLDGGAIVWDCETGQEIANLPQIYGEIHVNIAIHPYLPLVMTSSYFSSRIYIRDYQTGELVHSLNPEWKVGSTSTIWHPDGQRIFSACGESDDLKEYHFDPTTRAVPPGRNMKTEVFGGALLAINPAGDRIFCRGWSMRPSLIDLETGRVLLSVRDMNLFDNFRFSNDGKTVIGTVGAPNGRLCYGVFDIGDSREVRNIGANGGVGMLPVIHPGGRLVLIPQANRFTLVDLEGLQELGTFNRGNYRIISAAFDAAGNLYTNSFEGPFRWPVVVDARRVVIGLPERLPFYTGSEGISVSADGRTIAQAQFLGYGMQSWAGGWILTPERPNDPIYVAAGVGQSFASVTKDGRWVCFSPHVGIGQVYDAKTGAPIYEDTKQTIGFKLQFSPDDRWLVGNYGAIRTGTWDKIVIFDTSRTAALHDVSPDSRYALIGMSEGFLRLIEIETGRELARIEPPDSRLGSFKFSPDGTRLLESHSYGLRVWDLRLIRKNLAELGLDWDAPKFPEESQAPAKPLLELSFIGRDLLADKSKLDAHETTVALCRLMANPFDPDGRLFLGRQSLNGGRPAEALGHFRTAIWSRPDSFTLHVNAALSLTRLGQHAEAIQKYSAAINIRPDDIRTRLWRAEACRRIGQYERAVDDLTAVIARYPDDAELYECRADCYAAMGDDERAKSDRASASRFLPRSARGLNNRAWRLVMGPPSDWDPKRALELIRKAVEIAPEEALYQNTLGVVLYRNGRYTEAIVALEKSLAMSNGAHDGFDLYFLAMCYTQSGDPVRGRECLDRADKWLTQQMNLSPREIEELKSFQAEAQAVLRKANPGQAQTGATQGP